MKASRLHACKDCKVINKTNDYILINIVEMPFFAYLKRVSSSHLSCVLLIALLSTVLHCNQSKIPVDLALKMYLF